MFASDTDSTMPLKYNADEFIYEIQNKVHLQDPNWSWIRKCHWVWEKFYEYGKARSRLFLQDDLVEESKRIEEVKWIVTFVNSSEFKKYLQATPPVQQIASVRITPPTTIDTSPVPSHKKTTSEYSFFWDPEAEESKDVALNSANEVTELPAPVPIPIIAHKISMVPVQRVSNVC